MFNLDTLSYGDLFRMYTKDTHPLIRNYALNRCRYLEYKAADKPDMSSAHKDMCDTIYKCLPTELKW